MQCTHASLRPLGMALLAFILTALPVFAAEPAPTARVPQRILLGLTSDPAHSQIVTWRTETPVETPQAQIAPWTASPKFGDGAATIQAKSAEYTTGAGDKVTHYEATFTGLESNRQYGYRVGDGAVWSEWFLIRTAGANGEPFSFIYLGDAQVDVKSRWSRTIREAFKRDANASLVLYAGDLINNGYDDQLWGELCDGLGFIGSMIANLPAVGNHDMNVPDASPTKPVAAHPLWKAHFALPQNGPADAPMLEDEACWVDYQGVRFITLEANAFSPEEYDPDTRKIVQEKQIAWLEGVLRDNPNRWTIMLHHEPMYGVGRNPDNPQFRDAFLPLYDKYKVDLVLQGHDHVYARSHKLNAGKPVADNAPGTVYVVSVSGPKMYAFNPMYADLMAKTLTDTQLYQIVNVTNDTIQLNTYAVDGTWVDGFALQKDKDGNSTFTESSPPEVPQPR